MTFAFPHTPAHGWHIPYIGVPWVWQGRDPLRALDCWGVLHCAYAAHFGFEGPDYVEKQTAVTPHGQSKQTAQLIARYIDGWQEVEEADCGAGVLMRTGTSPVHVGLCVDSEHLIHSDEALGSVVCEPLADVEDFILGFFVPRAVYQEASK